MAEPAHATRPGVNVAEYSVSELSAAIKRTLEDGFALVRLRGEISGYRGPHASGHCYFALKDEKSKIEAVIWRGSVSKLRFKPQEGLEVVAQGRITSFPGASKYQIVIENLEPAGVGALMALLEERKRKFAAEGLFEDGRKRKLPFLPAVVGIVTSPTGAVIRDMLAGFTERFPTRVVVWPVRVQGETSAREVAAAVRGFNAMPPGGPLPRPDVLIVARGGGSLEDLWGFNEEIVVRAVAESTIPVISAVGHETDWTLIDLVADARAPTPTKAAEWAVPKQSELIDRTGELGLRLARRMRRRVEEARAHWRAAARGLPRLEDLVALPRQRFDAAEKRLARALMANTQAHGKRLARIAPRLQPRLLAVRLEREGSRLERAGARSAEALGRVAAQRRLRLVRAGGRLSPTALATRVAHATERFDAQWRRAAQAFAAGVVQRRHKLDAHAQMLASLSYRSVLGRGFALVRDASGHAVRSIAGMPEHASIAIEVADGDVVAVVTGSGEGRDAAAPSPAPAAASAAAASGQVGDGNRPGRSPRGSDHKSAEPTRTRPPAARRSGSDGQGSLF